MRPSRIQVRSTPSHVTFARPANDDISRAVTKLHCTNTKCTYLLTYLRMPTDSVRLLLELKYNMQVCMWHSSSLLSLLCRLLFCLWSARGWKEFPKTL